MGDFVIRADVPLDKLIPAIGVLLKREFDLPVTLERTVVEDCVIAVRGKIKPPFVLKPETPLELYAATLQPGKGEKDQGSFQEFLDDVGRFIEPNQRVVSEVENPPAGKDLLASQHSYTVRRQDAARRSRRPLGAGSPGGADRPGVHPDIAQKSRRSLRGRAPAEPTVDSSRMFPPGRPAIRPTKSLPIRRCTT